MPFQAGVDFCWEKVAKSMENNLVVFSLVHLERTKELMIILKKLIRQSFLHNFLKWIMVYIWMTLCLC